MGKPGVAALILYALLALLTAGVAHFTHPSGAFGDTWVTYPNVHLFLLLGALVLVAFLGLAAAVPLVRAWRKEADTRERLRGGEDAWQAHQTKLSGLKKGDDRPEAPVSQQELKMLHFRHEEAQRKLRGRWVGMGLVLGLAFVVCFVMSVVWSHWWLEGGYACSASNPVVYSNVPHDADNDGDGHNNVCHVLLFTSTRTR